MLEPNEKRMLERAVKLSEENNKMLHKMRRAQTWSTIVRLVYWGVIFGGAALAWYYLKPVYEEVWQAYQGVSESVSGLQETTGGIKDAIGNTLEQIGN